MQRTLSTMIRRSLATALAAATMTGGWVLAGASPASAGHTHYVATPNGECHQVAQGQTSISDDHHGGHHRYHDNVHLGATGESGTEGDDQLGHGHGKAAVYKEGPAPAECDGS